MIRINNKKKVDRWMYFYFFNILLGFFILIIFNLLFVSFLYLYCIQVIVCVIIIFFLFLLLNLRYIEIENSEAVLSIKEFHPIRIGSLLMFYRQVEIPLTEIHSAKVDFAAKKLLIFIKSKTAGKVVIQIFVLQYMKEEHLRKINKSLEDSLR